MGRRDPTGRVRRAYDVVRPVPRRSVYYHAERRGGITGGERVHLRAPVGDHRSRENANVVRELLLEVDAHANFGARFTRPAQIRSRRIFGSVVEAGTCCRILAWVRLERAHRI